MQTILHVVAIVFSNCMHRYCVWYIYANWNKIYKGEELQILF